MTLREFIFGEFDGAVKDAIRSNGYRNGIRIQAYNCLCRLAFTDEYDNEGYSIQHTDVEYRIIKELPNLISYKGFGQASYDFTIQRLHTVFRSFNN